MNYLIKTVETWRVPSEDAAKRLIEESRSNRDFLLSKSSSEYKCTKKGGEIVEDWYRVTLTKEFTNEKAPDSTVSVSYSVEEGAFPEAIEKVGISDTDDEDEEDDDNADF